MFKKIVIISLFFFSALAHAQDNQQSQDMIVKNTIHAFMQQNNVPGVAVELYMNGKPYSYYFGDADKAKKKPVTGRTIFELGSITKLMTCLLLAQEIDSAKVQIDNSITEYLPTLPVEYYEDITLLNLATHTSGLPFNVQQNIDTKAQFTQYLHSNTENSAAEEKWIYSNIGMRLIGLIIENAEHKDLNTLYRTHILNSLHMQPIGLKVPKSFQSYYAQGYDANNNPAKQISANSDDASGNARAMPVDMQRFLSAAIGLSGTPERILYPMRLTQSPFVTTNDFMQGLGWEIHDVSGNTIANLLAAEDTNLLVHRDIVEIQDKPVFNGNNLFDKTGTTEGFRSYIAVIPEKKTGIVILANKFVGGKPIVMTGRDILFKLNNIHAKEVVEEDNDDVPAMINHYLSE